MPVIVPQFSPNRPASTAPHNPPINREKSVGPYRVLCVAFGLVLLADVVHLYLHRNLFLATGLWPWFPVGPVCLIWLATLACLIFGLENSAAALVNWICCMIMLGMVASNNGFQQAAGDSLVIGIAFLLLILPRLDPAAGRWLVAAYLTSIYLDSGIHKLLSPMWAGGFGVSAPMTFPSLVWIPTNWMTWFPSWIWRFMGYGVVGFELLFGPLYVWKRTRAPALISGILLHLGIAIVYPIPTFGWIMVGLYAALLPEAWYRPLKRMFHHEANRKMIALNPRIMTVAGALWGLSIASVYAPPEWPTKVVRKVAWLTAGIASHEVFAEDAFSHYNYQLRLVGPAGGVAPYSRDNLLGWDVRDRVWELWWKRTQAPPVSIQDADRHLIAWAQWEWKDQLVRIEGRPQKTVTRAIAPPTFQQNDSVPWRQVGTIQSGSVRWQIAPQNGQERLGNYMERIWR